MIESNLIIMAFVFLFFKHCIMDFFYQPPYQWMNKGTYGHPGGLLHSAQHIVATSFLYFILPMSVSTLLYILIFEFIVHYHVDWAKMQIGAIAKWKCDQHPELWTLLGVDQLLHYLTYAAIIMIVIN